MPSQQIDELFGTALRSDRIRYALRVETLQYFVCDTLSVTHLVRHANAEGIVSAYWEMQSTVL